MAENELLDEDDTATRLREAASGGDAGDPGPDHDDVDVATHHALATCGRSRQQRASCGHNQQQRVSSQTFGGAALGAERTGGFRGRARERLVGAGPLGLVARCLCRLDRADAVGDADVERLAAER